MNIKTNLVLSGGGIKGIAHVGALYALDNLGLLQHITHYAGTSVGSLIIGLHIIGFSPLELYEFIKKFNFDELKNMNIGNIVNYGLDTGVKMEYVIKMLMTSKGINDNITLLDLYKITNKHVTFVSVCVNTMKLCYLSHEKYPTLEFSKAIMMSLAIPLIFCPIKYNDDMYVDGACINNFPINLFEIDKTIGIIIIDSKERVDINDFETYLLRVLKCISMSNDFSICKLFKGKIIEINANNINSVDFNLSNNLKDELFLIGYDSIVNNVEKLI